ncbi:MAG: undecaprenyl-diphosphate phosphatase [Rickettsiales bacterium]
MDYLSAAFLGIVEGLTEFIPVSSTGHLILFVDLLGFQGPPGHVFEVVIQLGAILAVLWVFRQKFLDILLHLKSARAQHFMRNIVLAFLPAMVVGALVHDYLKAHLFNPTVVALSLFLGGVAILVIERVKSAPRIVSTEAMGWKTALAIGVMQCVAMIPGVSRSGATIMGALMVGVERKAAAEFSFFLAVPTMAAATAYDLYKARHDLNADGLDLIAIGFAVSFVVALIVIRWLLRFVQTHSFAAFAYYRMALGTIILAVLALHSA